MYARTLPHLSQRKYSLVENFGSRWDLTIKLFFATVYTPY